MKNVGGREGGVCTAAAFLDAFTGGLPWAHLDIAGTAWIEKPREDAAAGATGVMVRTLTELARSFPPEPARAGREFPKKGKFVLRCAGGAEDGSPRYMRRRQPRKPGDSPRYVPVAELDRATVFRTSDWARKQHAECAALQPEDPCFIQELDDRPSGR